MIGALARGDAPDHRYPDRRGEYWALCPFHPDDHSGSFSVSERGFCCFSCGVKGNLAELAERLGVAGETNAATAIRQRRVVPRRGAAPGTPTSTRPPPEGAAPTHQRARDCVASPPGARSRPRPLPTGCTLAAYARAKQLPIAFLSSLQLSETRATVARCTVPVVLMPYRDHEGRVVAVRRRVALEEVPGIGRFRWRRGDHPLLYGLWRLEQMRAAGWVLLVEGESDAQTCWLHNVPALGVPGANTWQPGWGDALADLEVCVWQEPDCGGEALVRAVRAGVDEITVLRPPEGLKDLSEAHCRGMEVADLVDQLRAEARSPGNATPPKVASLAPWVNGVLARQEGRHARVLLSRGITRWLLRHKRLLVDVDSERVHLVDDRRAVWPLTEDTPQVRRALYDVGLIMTDPMTRHVFEALTMEALEHGLRVRLARWQRRVGERLYISSGAGHLVRAAPLRANAPREGSATRRADPDDDHLPARLERLPNGQDGVWFASNAAYPAWSPTTPVSPLSLAAFRPAIRAPNEVPGYTAERQRLLLAAWFAGILADARPLPGLIAYGGKGGGKSTLLRACARTLMGPGAHPTLLTDDRRDFWTVISSLPLVCLDNLDSGAPRWFADALAAVVTGIEIDTRRLYSDGDRLARPATAVLGISTRSASFCRPDVAERLVPITTAEFQASARRADRALLDQVDAARDGLLSWGASMAARMGTLAAAAPDGLPLRFVDYARLVWAGARAGLSEHAGVIPAPQEGGAASDPATVEAETIAALAALGRAQAMLAGKGDALVGAIVDAISKLAPQGCWQGSASALIDALRAQGVHLPGTSGGRQMARQLREARDALALANVRLREHSSGRNTVFTLTCVH